MAVPPNPPEFLLEQLGCCPLCGGHARELLHENLRDWLFDAPGTWQTWMCKACGCAYLDPRPTPETIALAYRRYYTHDPKSGELPSERSLNGLVAAVKNWVRRRYVLERFGPRRRFPIMTGLLKALPTQASVIDHMLRHLPRPWGARRLLDVGCGSGDFLEWARLAGWNCEGQEVDPNAAARARRRGLTIHEGPLEQLSGDALYEHVTVSHVIEHVHEPRSLLEQVRRLLVPGGRMWIEAPNLRSKGHGLFGRSWRGLEPPRHLQLLTHSLLERLCLDAGFDEVAIAPWWPDWRATFPQSLMLVGKEGLAMPPPPEARQLDLSSRRDAESREFVTLIAAARPRSVQARTK